MRLSIAVIAGGFAAFTTATTTTMVCNADNCLRAIRASAFPTRPGTADCSSYFITTVTPATHTSTVTPTVATETIFIKRRRGNIPRVAAPEPTLQARQVTVAPSKIPTYASACSGSVRYSSACSCIGVTATTKTAPTPTTVVTLAPSTTTVTDVTRPYVDFTGYDNGDCTGDILGSGIFVAGNCVVLPNQISVEDGALVPGPCADTSSCVLNLYAAGGVGSGTCTPGNLVSTLTSFAPGCVYIGIALYGELVCPAC